MHSSDKISGGNADKIIAIAGAVVSPITSFACHSDEGVAKDQGATGSATVFPRT